MRVEKFTWTAIKKDLRKHWPLYLMAVPLLAFFIIFAYLPMGGLMMLKHFLNKRMTNRISNSILSMNLIPTAGMI